MIWLIIRIVLTVFVIVIGSWLAFHQKRGTSDRMIGFMVIALALIQSADALFSISERVMIYLKNTNDIVVHDALLSSDKHAVETYNQAGKPLWRRVVNGPIIKLLLEDINGDGNINLVLAVGGDDKDSGKIMVYRESGELLWTFDAEAQYPYSGGASNRMTINDFVIDDFLGEHSKQIAALARDVHWYPSKLFMLDSTGKQIAEYWNPGHLHRLRVATDSGGEKQLIVSGINNDLRATSLGNGSDTNFRTVFALDPENISGQAPPYYGCGTKGTQLWYLTVMPQGESISNLELLDRDTDGVMEIGVWLGCGYVFYLDLDGNPIGLGRGDNASCDKNVTKLLRYRVIWHKQFVCVLTCERKLYET